MKLRLGAMLLLLYSLMCTCYAQDQRGDAAGMINLPSRWISRLQQKTSDLDDRLTRQTDKYLRRIQRRERRLFKKIYKIDSTGAKALFAGVEDRYTRLGQQLAMDTGGAGLHLSGEYQSYVDSLQGMLQFLGTGTQGVNLPGGAISNQSAGQQAS